MLSIRTRKNAARIQDLGNMLRVDPIKMNLNSDGVIDNCEIIYSGNYWKLFMIFIILARIILAAIAFLEVFNPNNSSVEKAIVLLIVMVGYASAGLQTLNLLLGQRLNNIHNKVIRLCRYMENVLGVETVEKDGLELVSTFASLGLILFGPVSLPLFVVGAHYELVLVDLTRKIFIGFLPVDLFTILLIWYGIWSGTIMYAIFALSGVMYSFVVSKWLMFLRWRPGITLKEKMGHFHIYRCLQVMNQIWLEPSKPLVGILLGTLAAMLNAALYLLIRGGFKDIDPIINSGIISVLIFAVFGLFYGGNIFFKFGLGMSFTSRKFKISFLQNENSTRAERAFFKSCRHISVYIGIFFPAVNSTLPLIFFGFILDMTIDLLLANP